ncbi:MAG: RagB/SusD family nutrient uptake outer membrane protein [Chitinophagaceae bacterium]|nr:RagB/SusD family nutrient uptake outer membrane protein [Chitinophagaceae bacterium]
MKKTTLYTFGKSVVASAILLLVVTGCKKAVTVEPPAGQLTGPIIFENEGTAVAALTGIYNRMINSIGFASGSFGSVSFVTGLTADELISQGGDENGQFYRNDILSRNAIMTMQLWNLAYNHIYSANTVIEGVRKSAALSEAAKTQLEGEARFIRAFSHFYLVNLWGKIPTVATTDYQQNNIASKVEPDSVYRFIENDLLDAINLLNSDYVSGIADVTAERIRPNSFAARALLARVYLYTGRWAEAEAMASSVIASSGTYQLANITDVFLMNNPEAIWQLQSTSPGSNTPDARVYIINEGNLPTTAILSPSLINTFEAGDLRRSNWMDSVITNGVTYIFPFKYKELQTGETKEYTTVMRLAEQYFIRAEARAESGNLTGAADDLNIIRIRAGLPELTDALTKDEIIDAVMHERRVEFFTEWGHRWLDLKRRSMVNAVMSAEKPASWQETDQLFPIPESETLINPRLTQNPGY